MTITLDKTHRCSWCLGDPVDEAYHDHHWGVPIHDDNQWLEYITLEGAQAGLSWRTIVNKIEGYKRCFHDFNIQKVASMTDTQLERLRQDSRIIRNKLKIYSTRNNAQKMIEIQKQFGTFDDYIWNFVNNTPIQNSYKSYKDIPSSTAISDSLSKDLKKRGFKFIGTTICYALMQAAGMVNDHTVDCFRHKQLKT